MPRFNSSATSRRLRDAMIKCGYPANEIEHGLALLLLTVEGGVTVWLPEAHPAREYLWMHAGVSHRIPLHYGWDENLVAQSIIRTLPAPAPLPDREKKQNRGNIGPRTPPRDRPCLPGCADFHHDHAAYDQTGRRIAHARLVCRACRTPVHYNTALDRYQHDDPLAPGCSDSQPLAVIAQRIPA